MTTTTKKVIVGGPSMAKEQKANITSPSIVFSQGTNRVPLGVSGQSSPLYVNVSIVQHVCVEPSSSMVGIPSQGRSSNPLIERAPNQLEVQKMMDVDASWQLMSSKQKEASSPI